MTQDASLQQVYRGLKSQHLRMQHLRIKVQTAEGQPTFEVPRGALQFVISRLVFERYGEQPNGRPHVWIYF